MRMRRVILGAAAAAVATVGVAGVAGAVPPGLDRPAKGEPWECAGEDVIIFTAGRNGWVGDTHYQAVQFSLEGTFTPTGGTPQPVDETKTWAHGHGLDSPDAVTCTAHFDETDSEGTFVADAEVIAVPVG